MDAARAFYWHPIIRITLHRQVAMRARSVPLLLSAMLFVSGCESASGSDLPRNTFLLTVTGDHSFSFSGKTDWANLEIVVIEMGRHRETPADTTVQLAFPIPPAMTEGVHVISDAPFPTTDADARVTIGGGALGTTQEYVATSGSVTVTRLGEQGSEGDFAFDATEVGVASPGHVHVEGKYRIF